MLAARRALGNQRTGPPALSKLVLWLDAAQITGVADGAALATWPDKSQSHADFTAAPANQPVFYDTTTANLINGEPAVKFTATSTTTMTNSGQIQWANGGFDLAAVVQSQIASAIYGYFVEIIGGNSAWIAGDFAAGTGYFWELYMGGAELRSTSDLDDNPHYVLGEWDGTNGNLYLDGALVAGPTALSQNPTGNPVGGQIGYGTAGAISGYFTGLMGEILVYNPQLTTTEKTALHAYLKNKWGTP